jgi:hypothetical protein
MAGKFLPENRLHLQMLNENCWLTKTKPSSAAIRT